MPHQIVGQVGIKIKTSITEGKESNLVSCRSEIVTKSSENLLLLGHLQNHHKLLSDHVICIEESQNSIGLSKQRICLNQDGRASSVNKISLPNLPILFLSLKLNIL